MRDCDCARLRRRLWGLLYFYGVLLVFVSSAHAWLILEPSERAPIYTFLLWIAFGVAFALLWVFFMES